MHAEDHIENHVKAGTKEMISRKQVELEILDGLDKNKFPIEMKISWYNAVRLLPPPLPSLPSSLFLCPADKYSLPNRSFRLPSSKHFGDLLLFVISSPQPAHLVTSPKSHSTRSHHPTRFRLILAFHLAVGPALVVGNAHRRRRRRQPRNVRPPA